MHHVSQVTVTDLIVCSLNTDFVRQQKLQTWKAALVSSHMECSFTLCSNSHHSLVTDLTTHWSHDSLQCNSTWRSNSHHSWVIDLMNQWLHDSLISWLTDQSTWVTYNLILESAIGHMKANSYALIAYSQSHVDLLKNISCHLHAHWCVNPVGSLRMSKD